jgi:hypothetical protein
MTALRLVPLSLHSALEMLLGLLLMVAPFVLGTSAVGMVAGVVVGALVVGLALQALDTGPRGALPVSAHHAADFGLALGMGGAAVVLASADATAALLFAAAAVAEMTLALVTRYSAR